MGREIEGVSRFESVTQPGASWKAAFGAVEETPAWVVHCVPNEQVPVGMQFAGPDVDEGTQPGGKAGAVTASKPSHKSLTKNGVGVGVEVGTVAVGVGEAVPVGVGVADGVGVGVSGGGGVVVGVGVAAVGVGEGEGLGVTVALGDGLGVAGGVGVGVGVAPVHTSGEGPWMPTAIGVPVLKKPTVAFTAVGGRLESKRKLYIVP